MQVLLTEDLHKKGRVGEVVDVKPGFARNYLFPMGLAVRARPEWVAAYARDRELIERRNFQKRLRAKSDAQKLQNKTFDFAVNANSVGQLYGSVSVRDIAHRMQTEGYLITASQIVLYSPLKSTGRHAAIVRLFGDVQAEIFISINQREPEAEPESLESDTPEEKKARAIKLLNEVAQASYGSGSAGDKLIQAARLLSENEPYNAIGASQHETTSMVRRTMEALDLDCFVRVAAATDPRDFSTVVVSMQAYNAIPTHLPGVDVLRFGDAEELSRSKLELVLVSPDAKQVAPPTRHAIPAADGDVGCVEVRHVLRRWRPKDTTKTETEIWAMAYLNDVCVYRGS